eukprot:352965-Chlamydomonas_euryale.AAC.6
MAVSGLRRARAVGVIVMPVLLLKPGGPHRVVRVEARDTERHIVDRRRALLDAFDARQVSARHGLLYNAECSPVKCRLVAGQRRTLRRLALHWWGEAGDASADWSAESDAHDAVFTVAVTARVLLERRQDGSTGALLGQRER